VSVDTHVPSSTAQTLSFSVWNVLFCLWITVLLRHPEINHMYSVGALCAWAADEKVVRLYVTVDKVFLMYSLYTREHLSGSHAHRLDRKLPSTHIKKIFQTRPQEIDDKDIVQALLAEMVYLWNAGASCQNTV